MSSISIILVGVATAHNVASEAGQPSRNPKPWAREDLLTIENFIAEILPDGCFAARLDNEHKIIAYTAGKMRNFASASSRGTECISK